MIAVLIPAHNERVLLESTVASIRASAADPALAGETVLVVVAADRCTDGTTGVAYAIADEVVELSAGNVGAARAAAASRAEALGARWLANTDADTIVPVRWLSKQLSFAADAFCGIVTVADWGDYCEDVVSAFAVSEKRISDHPHIHGANLGVSTAAYRNCGGFLPGAVHEDVSLVTRLAASGAIIAREPDPVVITSARRTPRARGGFGDYLKNLEHRIVLARPTR